MDKILESSGLINSNYFILESLKNGNRKKKPSCLISSNYFILESLKDKHKKVESCSLKGSNQFNVDRLLQLINLEKKKIKKPLKIVSLWTEFLKRNEDEIIKEKLIKYKKILNQTVKEKEYPNYLFNPY